MFTGIVEEVGHVRSIRQQGHAIHIKIDARQVLEDVKLGDSIAVNGVCLTVVAFDSTKFAADVVPETMRRTGLRELSAGSPVNLERAMALGDRFGGHIVSGHIDGVGQVTSIGREDNAVIFQIGAPSEVMRFIVHKGSITVDGVSLTVMDHTGDSFRISVIPHTAHVTSLGDKRVGSSVNLECDVIGKYVEKWMGVNRGNQEPQKKGVTPEYLREHGFL